MSPANVTLKPTVWPTPPSASSFPQERSVLAPPARCSGHNLPTHEPLGPGALQPGKARRCSAGTNDEAWPPRLADEGVRAKCFVVLYTYAPALPVTGNLRLRR